MIHRFTSTRPQRSRVQSMAVVSIFACLFLVISQEGIALSRDTYLGRNVDQEEHHTNGLPSPATNTLIARNVVSETLRIVTRQAVKRILRIDWDANTCRADIVAACVEFGGDAGICEAVVPALRPVLLSTGDMKDFIRCQDWKQITRQNPTNTNPTSGQID